MKKNQIVNNLIVFLAITGIYQTSVLWLGQTTGETVMEFILGSGSNLFNQKKIEQGKVLLATRYAIGGGDGFFALYYPDNMGESFFLEETNNVLNEILSDRNVYSQKGIANWKELLKNNSVILQYDFLVSGSDYLANYKNLKDNQPDKFDYLIIVPAERLGGESKAYFINSVTDEAISYTTNKSQTAQNLYNNLYRDDNKLTYISTSERMNSAILGRNIFLPQWASLPYTYSPIREIPIFGSAGAVNQVLLESVVKNFFNNFSVDWNNSNEIDDFMFSDNETIVRYNQDKKLLEYFNYSAYGDVSKETTLIDGYELSCNFIKNDISLNTDIYLTNIQRNGDETVYFFDYVIDHMPIVLSKETKDLLGCDYAIEVTVKNNVVKNYKRYMVNYVKNNEINYSLAVPFIDALDLAITTYNKEIDSKMISDVEDIYIGYYINSGDKSGLKWFITLYGNTFVIETVGKSIVNITQLDEDNIEELEDSIEIDELSLEIIENLDIYEDNTNTEN